MLTKNYSRQNTESTKRAHFFYTSVFVDDQNSLDEFGTNTMAKWSATRYCMPSDHSNKRDR